MLGTPVPEAAIDEDGEPSGRKHDVDPARDATLHTTMLEESKARAVEGRAKAGLGDSVPTPVALHGPAHRHR